ncbi:unnamed protein product [Amoebophrya sp. A25]|nr:unnamed protein product [Amoebophrya sp. A25]|eukprot:GSA25T00023380001.1
MICAGIVVCIFLCDLFSRVCQWKHMISFTSVTLVKEHKEEDSTSTSTSGTVFESGSRSVGVRDVGSGSNPDPASSSPVIPLQRASEGGKLAATYTVLDPVWNALEPSPPADWAAREAMFDAQCRIWSSDDFATVWTPEEQKEICGGCVMVSNFFMLPHASRGRGWGTKSSEAFQKLKGCEPADPYCSVQLYYNSAREAGCCVTILHDGALPSKYTEEKETRTIRFARVVLKKHDVAFQRNFNMNDVRFFSIFEFVCAHKQIVQFFFTDLFDVKVGSSPCRKLFSDTVFAGVDDSAMSSPWLRRRFDAMGSEYRRFYSNVISTQRSRQPMWSAGIVGAGGRRTITKLMVRILAALSDPNLVLLRQAKLSNRTYYQGINMAALNYVIERFYRNATVGGPPLNSRYRKYERSRRDVWFIHK